MTSILRVEVISDYQRRRAVISAEGCNSIGREKAMLSVVCVNCKH